MKSKLILALSLLAAGCATELSPQASKLNLITASQKENCDRLKLVTFNQRLGPDKPGNAMKGAMNEAAAVGADSFYILSTSTDWAEGASVVGEALRCKKQ